MGYKVTPKGAVAMGLTAVLLDLGVDNITSASMARWCSVFEDALPKGFEVAQVADPIVMKDRWDAGIEHERKRLMAMCDGRCDCEIHGSLILEGP